ncbi:hypothetical protein [Myxococcus landrumensis]|uniref:F5/8 type C domain-containing protein n=1 Tax=Myxococcus landrumensis TaxID=2813577 RepID=A0ABX7NGT8_9BACT|nr:hypothetical protein [Myxococcus landrumus]QSQ17623.1 hypothetical protein JY572_16950 [Myxococcus landrumus]
MRPWSLGLLLAALCGTGCEPFPDSPVYFYGLALREDGTPFSHTELRVDGARPRSFSAPQDAPDFIPHSESTTHANGAFALQVLAGDIQSRVEGRNSRLRSTFRERYRVATPLENGRGAFISFTLLNGGGDSELPVMRTWAANLALSGSAEGLALTFAPLPPEPQAPLGVVVDEDALPPGVPAPRSALIPLSTLELHGATGLLWQESEVSSPRRLPPWLLEDFASVEAQVRVMSAGRWNRTPVTAPESWLLFRLEWRSERLALPAGSLRPVSRGAACYPTLPAPCPFTDGALAPHSPEKLWPRPTPTTESVRVGVRLDTPTRVSRLVVRELRTSAEELVIEGSEDGEQWSELARRTLAPQDDRQTTGRNFREDGHADSPWDPPLLSSRLRPRFFLDLPLPDARPLRFIRLSPVWGGNRLVGVEALAELSLFEAASPP